MQQTASELAVLLNGRVVGNPEVRVRRLAKIESAGPGSVSFLSNPEYERFIYSTEASIVIVAETFEPSQDLPQDLTLLRVEDPYRAFARLLEAYDAILKRQEGIHPTAVVDEEATLGEGCFVGPGVVVERGAVVGDRVELHAHVHVGRDVRIDQDTVLHSGVRVLDRCVIGRRCTLQAGTIVGSDGFGFAPRRTALTPRCPDGQCCDRGQLRRGGHDHHRPRDPRQHRAEKRVQARQPDPSRPQRGHRRSHSHCSPNRYCGSTTIGSRCMIGGQVGIGGHLTVANGSRIAAKSGVSASLIQEGQTYQGNPAVPVKHFQKFQIALRRLARMPLSERLEAIEEALQTKEAERGL